MPRAASSRASRPSRRACSASLTMVSTVSSAGLTPPSRAVLMPAIRLAGVLEQTTGDGHTERSTEHQQHRRDEEHRHRVAALEDDRRRRWIRTRGRARPWLRYPLQPPQRSENAHVVVLGGVRVGVGVVIVVREQPRRRRSARERRRGRSRRRGSRAPVTVSSRSGLGNDVLRAVGQRDDGVGSGVDALDQVGIEREFAAVEAREKNHDNRPWLGAFHEPVLGPAERFSVGKGLTCRGAPLGHPCQRFVRPRPAVSVSPEGRPARHAVEASACPGHSLTFVRPPT